MNLNNLFYLSITVLCALGCYSQTPVLHAYDNLEDPLPNNEEPFQLLKIPSQTDLDLSLPPSSFMKIIQENEGVLQTDLSLTEKTSEEIVTTETEEE